LSIIRGVPAEKRRKQQEQRSSYGDDKHSETGPHESTVPVSRHLVGVVID
jgi:hypothetical protein